MLRTIIIHDEMILVYSRVTKISVSLLDVKIDLIYNIPQLYEILIPCSTLNAI